MSLGSATPTADRTRAFLCGLAGGRPRCRGVQSADSAGVKGLLVGDVPGAVRRFVSYLLYYHLDVAQRDKRSVSFPPELAKAIDEAAAASGSSFSAWIAETGIAPSASGGRATRRCLLGS
jgi:hypothetical protein